MVGCAHPFDSDHLGEFVERCRHSEMASSGLDTEFVVATAQVLHQGVTTDYHRRALIGLETAHRSQPGLEPAVVALDAVVAVSLGVVKRIRDQILGHRLQCLGQVGYHLVGLAMSGQRCTEESAGRGNVTASGHVHVDDLAVLVHGSVHVTPLAGDLDVGFVDEPAPSDGVSAWSDSPWVSRRLVSLDSNHGLVGLLGRVGGLEVVGRGVVEVAVDPFGVEPVNPALDVGTTEVVDRRGPVKG